jgi:hypothetical protein
MRCGGDCLDAFSRSCAAYGAAVLERLRSIVEGGEDVGVQIDHGYPA